MTDRVEENQIGYAIFHRRSERSRSSSTNASTLVGAGRVEILSVDSSTARVRVLEGSRVAAGFEDDLPFTDVYISTAEIEYVSQLITFLWGGIPCGERPPCSLAPTIDEGLLP